LAICNVPNAILFKGIKSKDKKALIVGVLSVMLFFTGVGISPKAQVNSTNKNFIVKTNKTVQPEKTKDSKARSKLIPKAANIAIKTRKAT